jgi:hypothetical protein
MGYIIAVLLCGRWCIDWNEASQATASFEASLTYMDEILEAKTSRDSFQYLWNFISGQRHLKILKIGRLFLCISTTPLTPENRYKWLWSLLTQSKNYHATDERAKVYSILGILEVVGCKYLEVDYNMSVCDLYASGETSLRAVEVARLP